MGFIVCFQREGDTDRKLLRGGLPSIEFSDQGFWSDDVCAGERGVPSVDVEVVFCVRGDEVGDAGTVRKVGGEGGLDGWCEGRWGKNSQGGVG